MADRGVHLAECGFVDDVSPRKLSDFTSIDCSESNCIFFSTHLLILLLKLWKLH